MEVARKLKRLSFKIQKRDLLDQVLYGQSSTEDSVRLMAVALFEMKMWHHGHQVGETGHTWGYVRIPTLKSSCMHDLKISYRAWSVGGPTYALMSALSTNAISADRQQVAFASYRGPYISTILPFKSSNDTVWEVYRVFSETNCKTKSCVS